MVAVAKLKNKMQRLIIVYNPRSSKHAKINQEVISPAMKLKGYMVGKFEVKHVSLDYNASNLSKIIADGDLVISAGGDGTSSVALNGILLSKKSATLAVLGYGNFNDFAHTLGYTSFAEVISDFENTNPTILYPLEASIDDAHYRYAACYFTIGMFAESTELFDTKKTRGTLKSGKKGITYSLKELAKWYFKNKKRSFLPDSIRLNDKPLNTFATLKSGKKAARAKGDKVSDIIFVNGETVAKLMKGGNFWKRKNEFLLSVSKLSSFHRLTRFISRSRFKRIPGKIVSNPQRITFDDVSEIEIQGEGEYQKLVIKNLTVQKSDVGIKVLAK